MLTADPSDWFQRFSQILTAERKFIKNKSVMKEAQRSAVRPSKQFIQLRVVMTTVMSG